jgi:hypothetical protein
MELQTLRIPSVMLCDTMVGSLFQHYPVHAVGMEAPLSPLYVKPNLTRHSQPLVLIA